MSKTILAVDDSGSLRQMVVFSLKAAGYNVTEAVDGWTRWKRPRRIPSTWS
jgi:two-component system chemotaxis response regulator CheY